MKILRWKWGNREWTGRENNGNKSCGNPQSRERMLSCKKWGIQEGTDRENFGGKSQVISRWEKDCFEVNSGLPVSSFPGSSWWGREKKPWAGEGQEKGPVGRGTPLVSPGHLWGTEWTLWEQMEVIGLSLWGMLAFREFHPFGCWNFPAQGLWLAGQHKDCSLCGAQIWGSALLVQMNYSYSPEFLLE